MRFDPSGLLYDTAYTAGGVFLLGKNYLIPRISWQVNTLLGLSFQTPANLDDDSVLSASMVITACQITCIWEWVITILQATS